MSIAASASEELLWCVRPLVDLIDSWPDASRQHSFVRGIARPFRLPRLVDDHGVLVATTTVNQRRTLDPVLLPGHVDVGGRFLATWVRGALSPSRAVTSVARWGDEAFREAGRPAVIDVWRTVLAKTDFLLRAYRGMDLRAFRAVLVGTQHDPQIRALLWAAREQGVPIVYLPHAPVADNPQYSDLPVDVVGLRGPAERSFYARSYGVEEGSMDVVGNTASDVLRSPLPDLSGAPHGVLALSPNREDVIRRIIGLVAESGEDNVLVAPHPRSDREQIRGLLPAGWRMSAEPRTLDVLRRGARFVLQYSSGVAWESAALGIPTGNIRLDGDVVNYPFLTDMTTFTEVRSPEDVRAFIAGAPRVDRDQLRARAREWCAHDGADAVVRARELLARVGGSGTAGHRLLDGWAEPDGPALVRSWLPAYAG